jgi:hypothetical protein
MENKITIKNTYHKALSFESVLGKPFSLEGGEVITVDLDIGIKLLKNVWVIEFGKEINPECLPYMENIVKDIEIPIIKEEIPIIENLPEIPIREELEMPIGAKKVGKISKELN